MGKAGKGCYGDSRKSKFLIGLYKELSLEDEPQFCDSLPNPGTKKGQDIYDDSSER